MLAQSKTPPTLTEQELLVLWWVAAELTDREIARLLRISERTVRYHLQNVYKKFDVQTRVGAVAEAVRCGLIL